MKAKSFQAIGTDEFGIIRDVRKSIIFWLMGIRVSIDVSTSVTKRYKFPPNEHVRAWAALPWEINGVVYDLFKGEIRVRGLIVGLTLTTKRLIEITDAAQHARTWHDFHEGVRSA